MTEKGKVCVATAHPQINLSEEEPRSSKEYNQVVQMCTQVQQKNAKKMDALIMNYLFFCVCVCVICCPRVC